MQSHIAFGATTLLPNGKQCFFDANGPLVSGSLNMFFPATTTPKPTWQDSGQVTLNSQPIQLDSNGCAVIYGIGVYRQQVYDGPVIAGATSGNLIWDQLTTDTSAFNSVFWAGLSAGSPNVVTIVDTGFNGTDGSVIQFVALATNTSSVTLNPSGFGAISVVKDTTAGPVALTGGEIIANNVISVVYYATSNTFHLLNAVIASASGATAPLCGASGLVITNSVGTPNTIITITANQVVMQTTGGLVINRSNISTSINISTGTVTSTAGGMDGEAPGISGWLYVWMIDNGSAASAIASLATGNGLTPNMPSGYTFKCRLGAMRVDGSGNLLRTIQNGNTAQYKITTGSNTTAPPNIANGIDGSTFSTTSPTLVTASVSSVVPSTAATIKLLCSNGFHAGVVSNVLVAPNTNWGGTNQGPLGSANQGWPCYLNGISGNFLHMSTEFVLEGTTIGYAADGNGGSVSALGWKDSVNAN